MLSPGSIRALCTNIVRREWIFVQRTVGLVEERVSRLFSKKVGNLRVCANRQYRKAKPQTWPTTPTDRSSFYELGIRV